MEITISSSRILVFAVSFAEMTLAALSSQRYRHTVLPWFYLRTFVISDAFLCSDVSCTVQIVQLTSSHQTNVAHCVTYRNAEVRHWRHCSQTSSQRCADVCSPTYERAHLCSATIDACSSLLSVKTSKQPRRHHKQRCNVSVTSERCVGPFDSAARCRHPFPGRSSQQFVYIFTHFRASSDSNKNWVKLGPYLLLTCCVRCRLTVLRLSKNYGTVTLTLSSRISSISVPVMEFIWGTSKVLLPKFQRWLSENI